MAGSKLLVACPLSRRGFFLAKMYVSGFLDLHFVRFCQIWSDFVKFVSDFARFGQIWTASKPASTTKSDWAGKRQTEPRQAGARLGLPVRLARKSARLAFDYPDIDVDL